MCDVVCLSFSFFFFLMFFLLTTFDETFPTAFHIHSSPSHLYVPTFSSRIQILFYFFSSPTLTVFIIIFFLFFIFIFIFIFIFTTSLIQSLSSVFHQFEWSHAERSCSSCSCCDVRVAVCVACSGVVIQRPRRRSLGIQGGKVAPRSRQRFSNHKG